MTVPTTSPHGLDVCPDRAVIDIGSNTVRMVVYSGSARAPDVWLNERVTARLGRDLAATGAMPAKAMDYSIAALARYATILTDLGITDVQTVATAAVRDASNGPEFLKRVEELGLKPRLLAGIEEAYGSAFGVIGAFPEARGTVADLGGGSLELVMIDGEECHDGVSLPLGTLRLPALREDGRAAFRSAVTKEMAKAGWATAHPGPLYMVGGTWRALALFAMREVDHPLTDPHGFTLSTEDAERIAEQLAGFSPDKLAEVPGLATSRANVLPDAAVMLGTMLKELQPEGLVFSSWGLREGLLFQRLPAEVRRLDPLIASMASFTEPRGGSAAQAAAIADWTASAAQPDRPDRERLRLAATMLALTTARVEPNLRARQGYGWAMDKRWVGLEPSGRACLAATLLAATGKPALPPELERLTSTANLHEAVGWGMAIRLCRRLGAASPASLANSELRREGESLILRVHPSKAQLLSDQVAGDLKTLAKWLGLQSDVQIGELIRG